MATYRGVGGVDEEEHGGGGSGLAGATTPVALLLDGVDGEGRRDAAVASMRSAANEIEASGGSGSTAAAVEVLASPAGNGHGEVDGGVRASMEDMDGCARPAAGELDGGAGAATMEVEGGAAASMEMMDGGARPAMGKVGGGMAA
nr:uncharacterized protein LOC109775780 [Aegilops tauschii subsp. strangulata]